MSSIKEVVPNLFMITQTIKNRFFKFSVNIYVVAGKDGLIFDSGYGTRKERTNLIKNVHAISNLKKSRGEVCTITRAIASHGHWDHFSGLGHLQNVLDLDILATPKQAEKIGSKKTYKELFWGNSTLVNHPASKFLNIRQKIFNNLVSEIVMRLFNVCFVSGDINIIDENTQLSINGETWQIIHVPGHSDDDIVLYNMKKGVLLGGDIIFRKIPTWLGPPKSDLNAYLNSLEHLLELPNLKLIFPAHGRPIENPGQRIQEIIDHHIKRTEELLQLILKSGQNGLTYKKILYKFYPKAGVLKKDMLGGWILVTLQYLLNKGDVIKMFKKQKIVFLART